MEYLVLMLLRGKPYCETFQPLYYNLDNFYICFVQCVGTLSCLFRVNKKVSRTSLEYVSLPWLQTAPNPGLMLMKPLVSLFLKSSMEILLFIKYREQVPGGHRLLLLLFTSEMSHTS